MSLLSDIITQLRAGDADFNDVADALELLDDAFDVTTAFVPTLSATGSMTVSSVSGGNCDYWEINKLVIVTYYLVDIVIGGTPSSEIRLSLPVPATGQNFGGGAAVGNSGVQSGNFLFQSSTLVGFRKAASDNFSLGSNNDIIGTVIYARS